MTGIDDHAAMRISDADRNGTLRRLHNAVALGLIDIGEFEERSALVSAGPPAFGSRHPRRRSAWARCDRHDGRRPGGVARCARLSQAPRGVDRADQAGAAPANGFRRPGPDQGALRGPDNRRRTRLEGRRPRPSAARRGQRIDRRCRGGRRQRTRPSQRRARRRHSPTSSSPARWSAARWISVAHARSMRDSAPWFT